MIRMTRGRLKFYRDIINKAATSLDDADAAMAPLIFEAWEAGVNYKIGTRIRYDDILYKVLQDHTSQIDWTPDITISLYAPVLIPDPEVIPDWVQPQSTNAYMTGDKVRHNDKIWISTVDYNVWEPGVYGWDEVI